MPPANDAWRRLFDGAGGRGLRARHGGIQKRPKLRGVVGACPAPELLRRQGAVETYIESWPE